MTDAIAAWVTSLGDFPLDPDAGNAWLWSGGGDRLIWASSLARTDMSPAAESAPADAALVRSFAPLLVLPEPDREPIRVHQLSPGRGPRPAIHTCLCRHVPLRDGGYGLLAVAIGAPARSMAEVRGEAQDHSGTQAREPASADQAEPLAEDDVQPSLFDEAATDDAATKAETLADTPEELAAPVEPPPPPPPPPEPPEWTAIEAGDRSPIRFVWQTDVDGRFVHISRELAAAVGPGCAMILGRTWDEAAAAIGLAEFEGVAAGFQSRDTWTAPPVLWPVENADLGVPVEMAGLKVLEAGRFDGFRGYGIARIERAVEHQRTAAEALADDAAAAAATIEAIEPETRARDLRRAVRQHDTDIAAATPGPQAMAASEPATTMEAQPLAETDVVAGPEAVVEPDIATEPDHAPAPALLAETEEPEDSQDAEPPPMTAGAAVEPDQALLPPEHTILPVAQTATPTTQPFAESSLSASEREAFREIAKALGAMTENLGRPIASQNVAPAQVPPVPERAREVRPLEIIRRDIVHLSEHAASRRQAQPAAVQAPPTPEPTLLDALPIGLLVVQDGDAAFANRHLLEMAGYPDLAALKADGGPVRLFGRREGVLPAAGRFDLTTRSGEVTPVDASVQSVQWRGAPAVLTTIRAAEAPLAAPRMRALEMDLRAAQSELRELRSVLDTATDGVILLDGEGRILSLNRSAEALFGYDQNEIAGEKLTLLLDADSHIAAIDYLEGLKSNGVNSILNDGRDVRGRERNGGAIPLFMTIGRVGEREGGAKFCAVLRDITHWKKVEADLLEAKRVAEDANAHKSDFLARISHEVRTPLNAIIGFSQVMMSESFGPIGNDRYRQYAKDIHSSGEHVVSLVNDLLDLSKIAAGRLDLAFGSVDVNAVVAGTVAMIQPQANAGRVIVRSQLAQPLPAVVADERSLRQIMLNLLSNAARYTEAGGQVVASTTLSENGEVVIRVSDTGIGMAEEEVRRAMEPFRQIPGPRSGGGTGLGLPLTKALVEANRAAFSIRSEPRKGTLVEVVFPSTRVLAE